MPKYTYSNEVIDAYSNQINCEAGIYENGEILGIVKYVLYNGELTISYIFVLPEYRRQGIASRLMKYIQEKNPEHKYRSSYKTEDGAKFKYRDLSLTESLHEEDISIEDLQEILEPIDNKILKKTYVPFRNVIKEVNKHNFYISSKADFKEISSDGYENIHHLWEDLKKEGTLYKSRSTSQYVIGDDILYRISDHWGGVASCLWTLDGEGDPNFRIEKIGPLQVGYAYYKDFTPYEVYFKKDRILDPEWIETIIDDLHKAIPILVNLKKLEDKSIPFKVLVGQHLSKYNKILGEIDSNIKRMK